MSTEGPGDRFPPTDLPSDGLPAAFEPGVVEIEFREGVQPIAWRISADGNTVTRLADSANQAGHIGDNALMRRPDGMISGVRTHGGNLKLIAWKVAAGDAITRTGDSANQAGTAARITLCQDALSGNAPVVTSVRTSSNNLKLITLRD